MGRTLTAIFGAVCCLALSACSWESVAGPPETTPTPSTSISTPSTTSVSPPTTSVPTPSTTPTTTGQEPPGQPPKLPAVAKEKSSAGAKAFVQYYIDAMNYAWISKSTILLDRLAADGCVQCSDIANGIDQIARRHGSTQGARWSSKSAVLIPFQPKNAPIVNVAIATSRGRWKPTSNDDWMVIQPSIAHWDMHLRRSGQGWVIASAVVQ